MLSPILPATAPTALLNYSRVALCSDRAGGWLAAADPVALQLTIATPSRPGAAPAHFERAVLQVRGVDRWNANPIANAVTEEDLAAPGPIIYGQVVQLYHGLSDTWLGVRRRVQSAAEKSSFQVGLLGMEEVEDVRAVRFKVLPRFKVRSDGERVRAGDQVLLVPDFDESRYLHAAASGPGHEVVCSFTPTAWTVMLYDDAHVEPTAIRVGLPIALWQPEVTAFLTCAAFDLRVRPAHGREPSGVRGQWRQAAPREADVEVESDAAAEGDGTHLEVPHGQGTPARFPRRMSNSLMGTSMSSDTLPFALSVTRGAFNPNLSCTLDGSIMTKFAGRKLRDFFSKLQQSPKEDPARHLVYFWRTDSPSGSRTGDLPDLCSNALWMLENPDPTHGGPVRCHQPYRLKHLATRQYLALRQQDDRLRVQLCDAGERDNPAEGLFRLVSFDPEEPHLRPSSFFVLHHVGTGLFLRVSAKRGQSSAAASGEVVAGHLALAAQLCPDEVFQCCLAHPTAELFTLSAALRQVDSLRAYVEAFWVHRLPAGHERLHAAAAAARTALGRLIAFCTQSDDPNPLTRAGVPIPPHQRTLLDQGVHHLVVEMLRCPFAGVDDSPPAILLAEVEQPEHRLVSHICRLGYRLLQLMVKGNSRHALHLSGYIQFMQSQLPCGFAVADTIIELFRDNRVVLEGLPEEVVDGFVRHMDRWRGPGDLSPAWVHFLSELCVCEGQGIPLNQARVCSGVLAERSHLLLQLRLNDDTLEVFIPPAQKPPQSLAKGGSLVPLKRSTSRLLQKAVRKVNVQTLLCREASARRSPEKEKDKEGRDREKWEVREWVELGLLYRSSAEGHPLLESQLHLFARVCLGRNAAAREAVSQAVTKDMIRAVLGQDDLPDRLLSLFYTVATHVYIDTEPSQQLLHTRSNIKYWHTWPSATSTAPDAADLDDPFLSHVRRASLKLLESHSALSLNAPQRNVLVKSLLELWQSLIRERRCTPEDRERLLRCCAKIMQLQTEERSRSLLVRSSFIRGPLDESRSFAKKRSRSSIKFGADVTEAAGGPFVLSEGNLIIMNCQRVICQTLNLMCDHFVRQTVDFLLDEFRRTVAATGVPEGNAHPPDVTPTLLAMLDRVLEERVGANREGHGPFGAAFGVAELCPVVWSLLLYEYDPLVQDALALVLRLFRLRKEVCEVLAEQQLLFNKTSESFWATACELAGTLRQQLAQPQLDAHEVQHFVRYYINLLVDEIPTVDSDSEDDNSSSPGPRQRDFSLTIKDDSEAVLGNAMELKPVPIFSHSPTMTSADSFVSQPTVRSTTSFKGGRQQGDSPRHVSFHLLPPRLGALLDAPPGSRGTSPGVTPADLPPRPPLAPPPPPPGTGPSTATTATTATTASTAITIATTGTATSSAGSSRPTSSPIPGGDLLAGLPKATLPLPTGHLTLNEFTRSPVSLSPLSTAFPSPCKWPQPYDGSNSPRQIRRPREMSEPIEQASSLFDGWLPDTESVGATTVTERLQRRGHARLYRKATGGLWRPDDTSLRRWSQPAELLNHVAVNQDMLRHIRVHDMAVTILSYDSTKDPDPVAVQLLCEDCCTLLQMFCEDHPRNQRALFALRPQADLLSLFLRHIPDDIGADECLMAVYRGNRELCAKVSEDVISLFVALWSHDQERGKYLDFLKSLTVSSGMPFARNQTIVMNLLVEQLSDPKFQDYFRINGHTPVGRQRAVASLVELMACCCIGRNSSTEVAAEALLPHEVVLKVLSEADCPMQLQYQLPYVTFLREVWWVTEEDAGKMDTASSQMWLLNDEWWFVMDRFHKVLEEFNTTPSTSLRLGSLAAYIDFIFNGIVLCLTNFFGICWNEVTAARLAPPLLRQCSAVAAELVKLMDDDERLVEFEAVDLHNLLRCLKEIQSCNISTPFDLREEIERCNSLKEELQQGGSARAEVPEWCHVRLALQRFQGAALARFEGMVVDDVAQFTALIHRHMATPQGMAVMRKLVQHLDRNLALPQAVQVGVLRLFRELIALSKGADAEAEAGGPDPAAPHLCAMQRRMSAPSGDQGLGAVPLMIRLASGTDPAVAYEAMYFGIALLEGGNPVAQDALLAWFAKAGGQFFHVTAQRMQRAVETLREREREKAYFEEQVVRDDAVTQAQRQLLERREEVRQTTAILRLLQLFCEGHHLRLQNYVREQSDTLRSVNLVTELVVFLKEVLALGLDDTVVGVVLQTCNTLTEFCQGPCPQNQETLASCDVFAEVNVMFERQEETCDPTLLFQMRSAAVVMLLSLLEGNTFQACTDLMAKSLNFHSMRRALDDMWQTYEGQEDEEAREGTLDFAFQLFSILHVLGVGTSHADVQDLLQESPAYPYLRSVLCSIEIAREDHVEKVYFRKPAICDTLTPAMREAVLLTINRQSPASKLSDFFRHCQRLVVAMEHQVRCRQLLLQLLPEVPRVDSVLYRATLQPALQWGRARVLAIPREGPALVEDLSLGVAVVLNALLIGGYDAAGTWPAAVTWGLIYLLGTVLLLLNGVEHISELWLNAPNIATSGQPLHELRRIYWSTVPAMRWSSLLSICFSVVALLYSPLFFAAHLLRVVDKSALLQNVMQSVTTNAPSLLLTALLCIIVVYLFSIMGFVAFPEDFVSEETGEPLCSTIFQCFAFSFTQGVRSGGGLGDLLRPPQRDQAGYGQRMLYDFSFYVVVSVCLLNIVFGIIVDTFAQLRDERSSIDEDTQHRCFICGIYFHSFDRLVEGGFRTHVRDDHNMWNYLFFMHYLRRKPQDEYTGQESYVAAKLQSHDISFFPLNRSLALQRHGGGPLEGGPDTATFEKVAEGRGLAAPGAGPAPEQTIAQLDALEQRLLGREAQFERQMDRLIDEVLAAVAPDGSPVLFDGASPRFTTPMSPSGLGPRGVGQRSVSAF